MGEILLHYDDSFIAHGNLRVKKMLGSVLRSVLPARHKDGNVTQILDHFTITTLHDVACLFAVDCV